MAPVSANRLNRLYKRFQRLDKNSKGSISPQDFMAVPELHMKCAGRQRVGCTLPLTRMCVRARARASSPLTDRIITVFDTECVVLAPVLGLG